MPHLRLEVPEEWLMENFIKTTGFDARKLLDHLVGIVAGLHMDQPAIDELGKEGQAKRNAPPRPDQVPMINKHNLKHALIPVHHSGIGGDLSKGFLHLTFAASNEKPGRTASVRRRTAETLGNAIDRFVGDLPSLESVTIHVVDIDRDRGYSTTAERKRRREE